ncbi:TetR/AcrR family transcriptional regulator [Bacillus coreaensis]
MPIVSEEHKRQRRNHILLSAQHCFAKKGYHITSMDQLVQHSGLSRGAIYNYFKSKEEIYLELMKGIVTREFEPIDSHIKTLPTNLEKIAYLFDHYFQLEPMCEEQKEAFFVQLDFQLSASRNPDMMAILEELHKNLKFELVKRILQEGKEAGELKSNIHVNIYTHMFWSFIDAANMQRILFPELPYQSILMDQKQSFLKKITK